MPDLWDTIDIEGCPIYARVSCGIDVADEAAVRSEGREGWRDKGPRFGKRSQYRQ